MLKTTLVLVIDHKKHIPDLLKLVEGRVYNLEAIEDVNAFEVLNDEVLPALGAGEQAT